LFTNVASDSVFTSLDVDTIYKVPRALYEQGLDDIVVKKLSIDCKPTDLSEWDSVVNKLYSPEAAVDIAMGTKIALISLKQPTPFSSISSESK
jgi:CTP synthase